MEYGAALHCCAQGDFAEGVRALLIDKDPTPRCRYPMAPARASAGGPGGIGADELDFSNIVQLLQSKKEK